MSRKAVIIVWFALAVLSAHAQDERKNEVGLLLGAAVTPQVQVTGTSGGKLEIGSGVAFQVTYARQLAATRSAALYFEVPAVAVPLQDITASIGPAPENYDSFFVTPGLRVKLAPASPISPWLSVGGGYALFEESAIRKDGTHNITRGTSGGAVQFGGGVDFRTPVKILFPIHLRAEARDFYTSKPNYNVNTGGGSQHNLVFSGGLVLRF